MIPREKIVADWWKKTMTVVDFRYDGSGEKESEVGGSIIGLRVLDTVAKSPHIPRDSPELFK